MSRRSARLHSRRRWRHSRHVFGQRKPLPRVPLPVLAVAVLLTIAVLALQGTAGRDSGSATVAAVGPQLAAYSVTAQELSIDLAEAADVPLADGVIAGASLVEGSTTVAPEAQAAAATPAPTAAATTAKSRAVAAPTTARAAATTAVTSTAAAPTTALATTAAPTTAATTTVSANPDGAPAGAIPLGEFTVVCYVIVGTTYSGEPTGPNVVAVDKSVIPLHTNLWIGGGVGPRTALDIGGGVKGKTLDLWMTWPDCKKFGKQHLNVYKLP